VRPRQFSDEELYAVARRCFLEHGPGVSTATIAAELGVSPPALFRRVGTKEELLRRSLAMGLRPTWIETLERGPDERPVAEQLVAIGHEILAFFTDLMPALATMRAAGILPHEIFQHLPEPPPLRAARAFTKWFAALHEQGRVRAPNAEAIAIAFLGCIQGRTFCRHAVGIDYPEGGPTFIEDVVEAFMHGITPQEDNP
jgi:AcrR family transcriptional regulator